MPHMDVAENRRLENPLSEKLFNFIFFFVPYFRVLFTTFALNSSAAISADVPTPELQSPIPNSTRNFVYSSHDDEFIFEWLGSKDSVLIANAPAYFELSDKKIIMGEGQMNLEGTEMRLRNKILKWRKQTTVDSSGISGGESNLVG